MKPFTKLFSVAAVALALSTAAAAPAHAVVLATFANFSDDVNGATTFKFTNNGNGSPKATLTGTGLGSFSFNFANFLNVAPPFDGNLTGVMMTLNAAANTPLVNAGGILEQNIDSGTLTFTTTGLNNLLTITFSNAQLWGSDGSFNFKGSDSFVGGAVTFTSDYADFTGFEPGFDNFAISLTTRTNVTTGSNGLLKSFTAHSTGSTSVGVPEPATWGLMIMGFGGVGAMLRRRRQNLAFA